MIKERVTFRKHIFEGVGSMVHVTIHFTHLNILMFSSNKIMRSYFLHSLAENILMDSIVQEKIFYAAL